MIPIVLAKMPAETYRESSSSSARILAASTFATYTSNKAPAKSYSSSAIYEHPAKSTIY
jgi:DNA primase catalytic subunit